MKQIYCLISIYLLLNLNTFAQEHSPNIRLLCNWTNEKAGHKVDKVWAYNDVYGWEWNGREYAVIGSSEGAHIIDITTCKDLFFLPGKERGQIVVHRDYKTYKNYLFAVCDEGFSSLQVYDYSYLPDSMPLVYESWENFFLRAHNIFIDTLNARLYAASFKSISDAHNMSVLDISNPADPRFIFNYDNKDNVHDVFVLNDTAYCSSSFYGYEVVDFSGDRPRLIGLLERYPYKGYNHSSWLNSKKIGVMADETHGMPLKVIDASDLSQIKVLSTFSVCDDNKSSCVPHNPYVIDNWVFLSYYFDGFQMFDIADPENPKRVAYYDTYPDERFEGFNGAWGCYPFLKSQRVLISDMKYGLFVLDVNEVLGNPQIDFAVYPNPASGYIRIQVPPGIGREDVRISIFDVSGKQVLQKTYPYSTYAFQSIELPLSDFIARGMYFVKINTAQHTYISKFIKQ